MSSIAPFSLSLAGYVSQRGLRSGQRIGGRVSAGLLRTWIKARRRGFASVKANGVEGGNDKLPLAGLKVLDMTRVLAGVRFFWFYTGLLVLASNNKRRWLC
jgi:hypothetical protein